MASLSICVLYVLTRFSVNAFSTYELYDAWMKKPLFIQFKNEDHGVTECWWSVDAPNCIIHVTQS